MEIKQILQNYKNKDSQDTMMWSAVLSMIQKEITETIDSRKIEMLNTLESYVKELAAEFNKWIIKTEKNTDETIKTYIETRKIEIKGNDGYTPQKGIDYNDGKDGYTPKKGRDYFDGEAGNDAEVDYERVQRGVLKQLGDIREKGNDIITKINNSSDKILISSVKNLQEELDNLRKTIKGTVTSGRSQSRGGGMGQPVHQRFDVTAATTGVTLSNNIAAKGTAIFTARYQGQSLDLDIDYSVNGKIITFLSPLTSNLVDGTVFSISFIRT